MAVKLNARAYDFAQKRIREGHVVRDERDAWSEHRPTADKENEFIQEHAWPEYGKWHLGVDDAKGDRTKGHYKFPYGDFVAVHRCAVLSGESRAGQYKHLDIEKAFAHLHGMIDK